MKVAFYSTKEYEKNFFTRLNAANHEFNFITESLSLDTVDYTKDADAVCCFVTDSLDANVIAALAKNKVKLIALRSAGYDHLDLAAAASYGIAVARVPNYSPEAVAEFAVALILGLSRKLITSYQQTTLNNFALENLLGFNLYKKTVGIIGTGNIGTAFARIMHGFGCKLLALDPLPNKLCQQLGVQYVELDYLLRNSDVISLHCLLNDKTKYIINSDALRKMKKTAMLINTGRGALVDTAALIYALENNQLSYAGLDVYEKERGLFFIDHSKNGITDSQFAKLRAFRNVLMTPHQAFFTTEAVENITETTLKNLTAFEKHEPVLF